ncbi:MAG: ATP-binding cassette domain-containing protein, partial [Rhizobiales bacterium]|nr:ATP-binding cassette domain-containing protein [Hyphomicrobiales bacterium]
MSDIAKRFGATQALEAVSLTLRPGEVHALLGENGAGKSTLVKCIMGFYEPTRGSVLVDGQWWAPDYAGEPLVSFERDLAGHLGLAIGDTVTVNVLGRNLTARIANLREVKWESLTLNFVMVFSSNALKGAPHNLLATVSLPEGVPLETEANLGRVIGKAFPSV